MFFILTFSFWIYCRVWWLMYSIRKGQSEKEKKPKMSVVSNGYKVSEKFLIITCLWAHFYFNSLRFFCHNLSWYKYIQIYLFAWDSVIAFCRVRKVKMKQNTQCFGWKTGILWYVMNNTVRVFVFVVWW